MIFIKKQFKKEFLVYSRKSASFVSPVVFFLISISLYPIAISSDPEVLSNLAPGLIWITVLLSTLISFQNIFTEDFEDGSIEILLSTNVNLSMIVLVKVLVNWIFSCLPIIFLSIFSIFLLYLPQEGIQSVILSLLVGTPTICLFGALSGALSLGKNSITGPALMLPLSLPILILGTQSISFSLNELSFYGNILLLIAAFIFLLPIILLASVGALKLHFN
ncbi:MAG: heme exporter protein CcmB [Gammaproteobacteria bacterium]